MCVICEALSCRLSLCKLNYNFPLFGVLHVLILVASQLVMRCFSNAGNYTGLSSLPDHYTERSRCLDDFRDMYGGELILPHATFIIESLMTTPRRNISRYYNLTHNASRSFFLRTHNITRSKSVIVSKRERLHESYLAQRGKNYSRFNLPRPSNRMNYSHQSRSSNINNMTQLRRNHHSALQAPIQGKQSKYLNATAQVQRSHQLSQLKQLKEEQWKHLNGSYGAQLQRQNHKPHIDLKPVGGQRRNSVAVVSNRP